MLECLKVDVWNGSLKLNHSKHQQCVFVSQPCLSLSHQLSPILLKIF